MKRIFYIVQKEFIQIFRNKALLPLIFIVPIFQTIILSYAATYEIKDIKMSIVDHDLSSTSRNLVNKFQGSDFFIVENFDFSVENSLKKFDSNESDIIIVIPADLETDLMKNKTGDIQILVNAINNQKAELAFFYAGSIIGDFNQDIAMKFLPTSAENNFKSINVIPNYWYNPSFDYPTLMVPGVVAELVTLLTMLLTALNIVREKEIGTIEQLNVTPIKKHELIIGKMIPFWFIGHFIYFAALGVGKLVFDIPIEGNLLYAFAFISTLLFVVLGLGLLISTTVNTQQEAMFVSFFFVMFFILTSGLFTPIESMPNWIKILNIGNPIKYAVEVNRLILLKNAGWDVVSGFCVKMLIYAAIVNSLAVWRYKKTV
jgi:ABC-2 type transport system permease protein